MKIALIAAAASLVAGASFAGGYVAPVAPAQPVVVAPTVSVGDWTGFYAGANVNWGKGKLKAAGEVADFLSEEGLSRTLSKPDGVSGAIRAGYDWQFGRGVFGLGGEYNFGKYDGGLSGVYGDLIGDAGVDANIEIKKAATIFARAGYAVSENLLAYGLLGYTWADGNGSVSFEGESESGSVDLDGVTVGIGAEYRFTNNWSGYAEYAYTDFGKLENTDGMLEADVQQIKLGVNYRF